MSEAPHVRVFADIQQLTDAVAEEFVRQSRARAAAVGRFSVALAGGSTPRRLYAQLGGARRHDVLWSAIQFFWSDERAVPLDHGDSNYRLAWETLFARGHAPAENIHVMLIDPNDPEESARCYEKGLREILGSNRPSLDWTLLGLGPDGHIASLFPAAPALRESARSILVVRDSPKPPALRLTMTLPLINESARVHILVAGAEKASAVRSTLEGPRDPARLPAQGIMPTNGTVTWWLDQAAASELSSVS